jgi:hypothetical protein
MMICKATNGKKFNVSLKDYTIEQSKELYKKMSEREANGKTHFENNYLGKKLTVYYEEMSKDEVPQRAKTSLVVRDYE